MQGTHQDLTVGADTKPPALQAREEYGRSEKLKLS